MSDTKHLLINLILYCLLPLWGITGFVDWCCHRATHVEQTSGLKESLLHSLMGVQLGIDSSVPAVRDQCAHPDGVCAHVRAA